MKIVLLCILAISLSGCAYKELMAPCGPDEAGPLAYADTPPIPAPLVLAAEKCGPMRTINSGQP